MADNELKDALVRGMMAGISPQDTDELLLLCDALRMWAANPGLRNELVAKRKIDPKPMMTRAAMVLATIGLALPADVPDDYKPEDT